MSQDMNVETGHLSFLATIFLGMFTWFGENLDTISKVVAIITMSGTAIFAAMNYYYSMKKNKLQIKRIQKEDLEKDDE